MTNNAKAANATNPNAIFHMMVVSKKFVSLKQGWAGI
jgi:hypothetical protein